MQQIPNFENQVEKQKKQPEGQFSGEAKDVIRAKEMLLAVRSKYELKLSQGEITSEKYAEKMGNINKALVYLDKKVTKFSPEVQEAFGKVGNEGEVAFEKEGTELIGLDKDVAIESGKDVVAILEQEQGIVEGVEKGEGIKNSGNISSFESREFKEMSPQEKAGKNITANLAKLAEANPSAVAEKIQQLAGITVDPSELLSIVSDKQNRGVMEQISQELLKNFEFRIQEPTTADSFAFIVLDPNNLSGMQRANFGFMKDLAMGPGYGSEIKNYSLENGENRVIAYTKDFIESAENEANQDSKSQTLDSSGTTSPDTESKLQTENEDKKNNPDVYYAQSKMFTVNGSEQSFKLPDQLPKNTKAEERLAILKNQGVGAYKASVENVQANLSNVKNLEKPTWEPTDQPVAQQFQSLANSSLDQEPLGAVAYSPDISTKSESPKTQGPVNNIVDFKRKKSNPEIDISSGKNNIKPFDRKSPTSVKNEGKNTQGLATSKI
jgi:hypothetical protein